MSLLFSLGFQIEWQNRKKDSSFIEKRSKKHFHSTKKKLVANDNKYDRRENWFPLMKQEEKKSTNKTFSKKAALFSFRIDRRDFINILSVFV